jgi:enoyl-CoA hydratase
LPEYTCLNIERGDRVATIRLKSREAIERGDPIKHTVVHTELADALQELRADNGVRIIVLTGTGNEFGTPPTSYGHHGNPGIDWDIMQGTTRCIEAFIETEKPIIAKVNGPAIGFRSSIIFASDIIVAREDALIADHHLGARELEVGSRRIGEGVVPGDGGSVFVPLYFSPALAKEYLFLAKPYTAGDLAKMHLINYAVPADELDEKVEEIVQSLLKRPAYALAWSKRVVNRRIAQNFNQTFDAGIAYEILNFYMQTEESKKRGGDRGLGSL